MNRPQDEEDADESSGVTTLLPVVNKTARLFELAESDSTSYFSASELLERGKALAARTAESLPPPAVNAVPEPEPELPPLPEREVRRTSFARKAIAILLPLLCALLLAEPLLKNPEQKAINQPTPSAVAPSAVAPSTAAPSASALAKITPPVASATPDAPPVLPRGMTPAHAAADSVATGDFSRALGLYRELARQDPKNQAYREAARILGERAQTRSP